MNHCPTILQLSSLAVFIALSVVSASAQNDADKWLRVLTGEESTVDVLSSSLILESNQIITAKFKTTLAKPEAVTDRPGVEYSFRIDSVQFDTKDRRYRIAASSLLTPTGESVDSVTTANEWKPLWGLISLRMYSAALQLRPFGEWRVVSYRYASGETGSEQDPPELKDLVGSRLFFTMGKISVGNETCVAKTFEPKTVSREDLSKTIGSSFSGLGIRSNKVDSVLVDCEKKKDVSSRSIMLRLSDERSLLLWDGVFLELERARNIFLP